MIDPDRFAEIVHKRRDREFIAAFLQALAENGGEISEGVLLTAASQVWRPSGWRHRSEAGAAATRRELVNKAKATLGLSTTTAAIAEFYGLEAKFTLHDAIKLHVQHIKGIRYKKTVFDKDGIAQVVTVREPPSYEALRDFLKMALPKEPKQINIDQRTLTLRGNYTPPDIDVTPIEDTALPAGAKA